MGRKVLFCLVGAALLAAGFFAGYVVGRQHPPAPSATDRLAQHFLEEAERNRPPDAQRQADAEALHKAFMGKLARDFKRISDPGKDQ